MACQRGLEILKEMGVSDIWDTRYGAINGHLLCGTCRAGSNPNDSVLNRFCQSHEVPNLFVVDGSFMPTSGGVPATLTILANSFRVADFIKEQARTGACRA